MSRLIVLFCAITYVCADVKQLHKDQLDLFKYDPSDVYSLPEDIDDEKPATIFHGDVMQAKTERLQSLTGSKKYKLDLKTQNGIEVSSVGKLRDDKTFVVSGSYSFTGADGKRYRTRYTADEFGYHPITELDLDIPEPQPLAQAGAGANRLQSSLNSDDKFGFAGFKNRFQFLNQNLDDTQGPYGGSSTSGDDYSYDKPSNGYTYERPEQEFESRSPSEPSRQYLPVQ